MTTAQVHRDVLTQEEAQARAARVSNCRYTIDIDLQAKSTTYRGDVTVEFDLSGEGDLFLDFRGKEIHSLRVNGREVEPDWTGYRLTLPADALGASNRVEISYTNEYDTAGDGFHHFVDPEDGEEYMYSQCEPYDSHRIFPNFDQPDIKATYRLTVTAPSHWRVVANSPEESATPTDDGRTRHVFEETPRFSTYLFALIVGPYEAFHDEHRGIPLGLYCRKSLAKYIDTDELFEITKQGLDFFVDFFAYPYPFKKYDQLFVPENNAGAMENVGAVTHNEAFIYRDPPTDNQRRRRAEVILHEMAHMWFGNLVTMRWWNDLWLNESFATYMSYLAMTKATRFTTGWQDFNQSIKNWAYRQDQLVTTHPISGEVRDTDETFLNFDGITYGKGASVLKQLAATIGEDGFREGTRRYFRKYEYQNATLQQFLGALEEGSGQELGEWARLWLETPSLNTIAAEWDADGDRVSRMVLVQTAPEEYPTLRPHRLDLALVRDVDGRLEVETFPVRVEGRETEVPEAIGRPKPDLVFPNWGDHAYAKIALDPLSAAWVRQNIERVEDTLLRQLLWSSLWNMVRDQQLKSTEFLAIVREKAATEQVELVDGILGQATAALARYVPEEMKDEEGHKLFEAVLEGLRQAPAGDAKIIWMRALIASAIVPEDIAVLGRLADGEETIEGLTVDQDMRWSIAAKYVAYDLPGAQDRVEREAERDPSDRGQRARLRCETSAPKPEVKHAAWERFNGEGYGTLKMTEAAMSGFLWSKQRDLLEPYVEKFFEQVPEIVRTKDREYYSSYFGALFPGYRVEREILERSKRLLEEVGDELPTLARMLREANDDLARAIACREYAAS